MTTHTTLLNLAKSGAADLYNTTRTDNNSNADILEAQVKKCYVGTLAPTSGDDSGDGYSIGSHWVRTVGPVVSVCTDASVGAAYWRQVWPAGIWGTFPGTPTRVSGSQFTVTDAGGANSYVAMFPKGTVIKWKKSGGGFQCAMIIVASYNTNVVTIDICGNDLVAGFTDMKYCAHRAKEDTFIVPGNLPGNVATADISKTIFAICDLLIFGAQIRYKTAATTTKGVWDVNDDATTIFATKPEILATATLGVIQVSNCLVNTSLVVVAKDSAITLDYDSGNATTPGVDGYITIFSMPAAWRYQE
jgi:hypothetical protein